MNTIRRIDWHAQLVIGVLGVFMLWTIYISLIGEAILGVWQLISAMANTPAMLRSPFKKQIKTYWILVIVSLVFLLSPGFIRMTIGRSAMLELSEVLQGISIVGSWAIAWYYWRLYKLFIEHLEYRKELDTLIRH
jgi:hypothetical protein